jgi:hypothetical protein
MKVRGTLTRTAARTDKSAVNTKTSEPKKPPTECSSSPGEESEERPMRLEGRSQVLRSSWIAPRRLPATQLVGSHRTLREKREGGKVRKRRCKSAQHTPSLPSVAPLSGPGTTAVLLYRAPFPHVLSSPPYCQSGIGSAGSFIFSLVFFLYSVPPA